MTQEWIDGDGRENRVLRLDYDVDSPNRAYGGVTFGLNHADASGCVWLDDIALRRTTIHSEKQSE